MIETATGVAFLLSSLYGAGMANAETATAAKAVTPVEEVMTVEAIVRKAYADRPILVEIARCESTFRHYDSQGKVLRGKVDPRDVGVMQINTYYHGETAKKLGIDLETIEGNLKFASYLYEKNGSRDWQASAKCWS